MELTPGIIVIAILVVVVGVVLMRWGARNEAAPPEDVRRTPVTGSAMGTRDRHGSEPLVNWLLDRAFEQTGVRVADDALARERIAQASAKAMEELRSGGAASVSLPFLVADASGPKHFDVRFKRNVDTTFEVVR